MKLLNKFGIFTKKDIDNLIDEYILIKENEIKENDKYWISQFENIPTIDDVNRIEKEKEEELCQIKEKYTGTLKIIKDDYNEKLEIKYKTLDKRKKELEFQIDKYKSNIKDMDKNINKEIEKREILLKEKYDNAIEFIKNDYNEKIKEEYTTIESKKRELDFSISSFKDKSTKLREKEEELNKVMENNLQEEIKLTNKEESINELLSHNMNKTIEDMYNEVFENQLNDVKNFYATKKNPSKKASEFIGEFKDYIKELEIDNRKLRLALSEYVDGIEGYNEVVKQRRLEGLKNYNSLSELEKREMKLKKEKEKEKNQLEIGYSFERYYGYLMEEKGYSVDYRGLKNGKNDGGIDLVAKNKSKTVYIQCKYWSSKTVIRENTISQLYGSSLNLALQSGLTIEEFVGKIKSKEISMVLATHTILSPEAKEFANRLGIDFEENIELQDYPMVKLVEGEDKIYYIPTDNQYDAIIYNSTDKTYGRCFTCEEAEVMGFRGAKKWLGYL